MRPVTRIPALVALVAIGADRAAVDQRAAPADLLIVNGRVFTATCATARQEAVRGPRRSDSPRAACVSSRIS
jgi:hypothetical protein